MAGSVRFGAFEFDPERRELRKYGLKIRAPDQSLDILVALLEHPGETVSRERIQSLLWPHGTVVGFDQSINAAVKRLRKALGDPADRACFIERVRRQGYRFIALVERLPRAEKSTEQDDRAGTVLLHYRLVEKAGSGSMGEVWKAEDTKLSRTVALKFVPQRLAADADALEAFCQEARQAAALNHPNICTIHGLEEHAGQRSLVMEYIDGRPLNAALDGGPLSAQRVVEIGIQAAEALAAAHASGVIHRDVKPPNLMLTEDGRVKLTDFGIATAVRGSGSSPVTRGAHTPAGTLGYMSPEQARGEVVDARSDLFSLGAVLYEMATGRRPFRGDTPAAVFQAVLHQEPERPRTLNRALPGELERVILRALEKDVAARWQSASEMAGALRRTERARASRLRRRVVLAAAAIAAAAIAAWLWMRPAPVLAERDSIVVAEFENRTGDAVFDGALRQALLSQMGQSRYLSFVSEDRIRAALRSMGRSPADRLARDIAREVCQRAGGKAVLVGSIGSVGSRYYIGLDTVGCAGGEALGSEYAEAESRERVLTALSRAVSELRGRLGESLASTHKLSVLAEATTPSLEALRAYSVALDQRAIGNDAAPLLRHAIQLDPEFAAAHFTLARAYQGRGLDAEAEAAITKAYALRGRTSERERLAIEGLYHSIASGDALQGIAVGTLAAQLYPRDSAVWKWSVQAYWRTGEYDKALQVARREVEVAADDGASYFEVAGLLINLGRTAEASAVLDQAVARGAGSELFSFARYILAALDGDFAAMEREAQAARGKPIEQRVLMLQAQAAGFFGQLAKAREVERSAAKIKLSNAPALMATVALTEALFGFEREARSRAKAAVRLDRGRRTGATSALTLALTNQPAEAQRVMSELLHRYPNDTLLKRVWSPAMHGAIALNRGDARRALEAAEAPSNAGGTIAWLPYIRGAACLWLGLASEAAAEFRRVIEQKGSLFTSALAYGSAYLYPAAQLGLARALAMGGQVEQSRKAYEEFLAWWSRADSDIPILVQAKAEHAALSQASAPRLAPSAEQTRPTPRVRRRNAVGNGWPATQKLPPQRRSGR